MMSGYDVVGKHLLFGGEEGATVVTARNLCRWRLM